ncbi:MAG: alginate export family protein [Flavobacteriaceae bacterium]|nr:alginate export family protein [Flavobacteriaceae bacterium]
MKRLILTLIIITSLTTKSKAQELTVSGELRPRLEARHGVKTLATPDDDPAVFVSQRTRINLDYNTEKYEVFFALQNVRVWGDVSTLASSDKNGIAFHEAWGEYKFNPNFSIKLGRQEIAYDDQRIFGAVGWAQQARSHDALLAKFKTGEKGNLHIGLALNANGETLFEEDYAVNQYKSLQYAWYHTNFSEAFGLSALFLNNGMTYDKFVDANSTDQKTTYSQTLGGRLTYKKNRFNADAATYFQGGNTPNGAKDDHIDLSAYNFTINAKFNISEQFLVGAGIEILSGNDQGSSSSKDKAFKPFYGTNHKFNGWMDYFYVGNHMNSVGLVDINTPMIYKKDKFSATLIPHFFSAEGDLLNSNGNKADAYLGTEIDLNLAYKAYKNITFNLGYSHLFATDSMEIIKGGSKDETNNWIWAMVTFKPTFFNKNFNQ